MLGKRKDRLFVEGERLIYREELSPQSRYLL